MSQMKYLETVKIPMRANSRLLQLAFSCPLKEMFLSTDFAGILEHTQSDVSSVAQVCNREGNRGKTD